jgi:hypothetical protein
MIEKQDKYFEKDITDDFFIIQHYADENSKNVGYGFYSSDDGDEETEKVPELHLVLNARRAMKPLTEYIVAREIFWDNKPYTKTLVEKDQMSKADRIMILEHYGIDFTQAKPYLEESDDEFFERFRIRP